MIVKIPHSQNASAMVAWHDHSTVGGHGHFLVLTSCIFDPAFYYTSEEMRAMILMYQQL